MNMKKEWFHQLAEQVFGDYRKNINFIKLFGEERARNIAGGNEYSHDEFTPTNYEIGLLVQYSAHQRARIYQISHELVNEIQGHGERQFEKGVKYVSNDFDRLYDPVSWLK